MFQGESSIFFWRKEGYQGEALPYFPQACKQIQRYQWERFIYLRIIHCTTFKEGSDEHNRDHIKHVKTKLPIYNKWSCWYHETKNCKVNKKWSSIKKSHIKELCCLNEIFNCLASKLGGSYLLCLKDIHINEDTFSCVFLNNASEVTLILNKCERDNGLPYEAAGYTWSKLR